MSSDTQHSEKVMKYEAEIDGRRMTVELEERDGRVTAKIDSAPTTLKSCDPKRAST